MVMLSCRVSSTILVVGLVMEYLHPTCNQVLRISIEILTDFVVGLESRLYIVMDLQ
jgi:hypothetical protein